jgi:phage/plasmid-like protein (TIGR03299 family)
MSHEVETMMYAGEVPWHGLGVKVDTEVTAGAAIKLAGMDWKLEKRPIYISGNNTVDGIPVIGSEITGKQAIVRVNDNKPLGIVGNRYNIIDNAEAFDFMDSLVGEGQAIYHTAGSLFGGRKIFILVKLPSSIVVAGVDTIEKYLLLTSSHDGTSSTQVFWTPVRVVCNNTLSAAIKIKQYSRETDIVKISHTKNFRSKLESAREVLKLSQTYYDYMEKLIDKLVSTPMDVSEMKPFVEKLLPAKEDSSRSESMVATKHNQIIHLFSNGRGNDIDGVKNTRWAAYNAVTEYVDHYTKYHKSSDLGSKRFENVLCMNGKALKDKAIEMLVG